MWCERLVRTNKAPNVAVEWASTSTLAADNDRNTRGRVIRFDSNNILTVEKKRKKIKKQDVVRDMSSLNRRLNHACVWGVEGGGWREDGKTIKNVQSLKYYEV